MGAVAVDFGLLRRRREFGLLVVGQTVSELGSMATFVAIPFQAYELTGSSLAVGLLGVAEFAPIMVLALVGGALADAFDRRRLVQIAEVGAGLVAEGWAIDEGTVLVVDDGAVRVEGLGSAYGVARRDGGVAVSVQP